MKTPALRQLNAADRDLSIIQGYIGQKFADYDQNPFIGGNLLTNVVVTNAVAGTKIAHGLTIVPTGWFIADKTSLGDIIRLSWDKRFITLQSSATSTTLNIWVF